MRSSRKPALLRRSGTSGAPSRPRPPRAAVTPPSPTLPVGPRSVYATVLSAFFPHVAPRLFQHQHFITLKARSFRTAAWLRYDSKFRIKLAANESRRFDSVDTELWASCFAADGLSVNTDPAPPTMAFYACGSASNLYAACPQRRQPPLPRPVTAAKQYPPRSHTPANPPSRVGEQRKPCYIFNDKGRCFRGARCPYLHTCTLCGGQHAKRSCPTAQS